MRAHGHGVRHWRRAIPAAAAALAIWAGLGGTALLLADQRPAAAQSAEAVGRIAQAITVRIEGATQGSGVLVRREGNRYTVLTAWHVVADQKPGEELDIYAPDGNRYPVEQGSIKRLGEVDLAVLTFSSDRAYTIAITGEPRGLPLGSSLYVSGFPLGTSSVPLRLMRLLRGDLVGNGVVDASRSQHLLYSNPTLPGMSGGAVLNLRAELIGIHINAERADQISESTGKPVATGVNQGLAIGAYRKWVEATAVQPNPSPSPSALTRQAAGQEAIPEPLKGVSDAVAALRPPSAGDRIWVKVSKPISIEELATSLNQDETRLARLNAVNEDYQFKAGDWLVLPSQASRQVKQLDALDASELRLAPPTPITMQSTGAKSTIFQALRVDMKSFIAVAKPVGQSDWRLEVYEQITPEPLCWQQRPDGLIDDLLIRFDYSGICKRYLGKTGYSIRIGNEDLYKYWLRLEQRGNNLLLIGISPDQSKSLLIGRGELPRNDRDGSVQIRLESGWALRRRAFDSKTLYHIYFFSPGRPVFKS